MPPPGQNNFNPGYASKLNAAQKRAVLAPLSRPLAVVAGAGSGKTSVLTARIQHMLANGVPPRQILAITFTKAAAEEMRARLEKAVGRPTAKAIALSTFHSLSLALCRSHAELAGRKRDFAVRTPRQQLKVVRKALAEWKVSQVTSSTTTKVEDGAIGAAPAAAAQSESDAAAAAAGSAAAGSAAAGSAAASTSSSATQQSADRLLSSLMRLKAQGAAPDTLQEGPGVPAILVHVYARYAEIMEEVPRARSKRRPLPAGRLACHCVLSISSASPVPPASPMPPASPVPTFVLFPSRSWLSPSRSRPSPSRGRRTPSTCSIFCCARPRRCRLRATPPPPRARACGPSTRMYSSMNSKTCAATAAAAASLSSRTPHERLSGRAAAPLSSTHLHSPPLTSTHLLAFPVCAPTRPQTNALQLELIQLICPPPQADATSASGTGGGGTDAGGTGVGSMAGGGGGSSSSSSSSVPPHQAPHQASAAAGSVTVVGDDDQGIYSFQGASGSFSPFESAYPSFERVLLEQNYRSTATIVTASSALISHNVNRVHKTVVAAKRRGGAAAAPSGAAGGGSGAAEPYGH